MCAAQSRTVVDLELTVLAHYFVFLSVPLPTAFLFVSWPAHSFGMNLLTAAPTTAPFRKIDKALYVGQWLHAHVNPLVRAGRTLEFAFFAANDRLREDARMTVPVHFITRWNSYLDDVQSAYEAYVVKHARLRRQYDYWYASRPWATRSDVVPHHLLAPRRVSTPVPGPERTFRYAHAHATAPYRQPRINFPAPDVRTHTVVYGPPSTDKSDHTARVRTLEAALRRMVELHHQTSASCRPICFRPRMTRRTIRPLLADRSVCMFMSAFHLFFFLLDRYTGRWLLYARCL